MGFDLTITKGNLRLSETRMAIRELIEFAMQMELEVIPVNWMVTGIIHDMPEKLREIFGEAGGQTTKPLVGRPIAKITEECGSKQRWFSIEGEHIQGIIFYHHYEEWILTWNVSRGGLLGSYWLIRRGAPRLFDQEQAISPKALLEKLDDFINSTPTEVQGEFSEEQIRIHCPWRRSDVAAACDLMKMLAHHCNDFSAQDDFGVWPDKDFTKWSNFADKYAKSIGSEPVHPDGFNELRYNESDHD